ncbi:Antidote-toxin recognition MazE, bacterial antitoxin [uncultured archaeon]|nr:Antidote-toxin recognition MazE, bacterial antitoxin [uncultured archaeon]
MIKIKTFISKNILTEEVIVKTVKVSDKGQIAIPLEIREETGIGKGDELILVQEGKRILIEPVKKISKQVKDDFSDLLKLSEKSLKKLWDNKADKVWDNYK